MRVGEHLAEFACKVPNEAAIADSDCLATTKEPFQAYPNEC